MALPDLRPCLTKVCRAEQRDQHAECTRYPGLRRRWYLRLPRGKSIVGGKGSKHLTLAQRRSESLNCYIVRPSLLRNRGRAAKDILRDLAGGCFQQLGHKLDSLGTLEMGRMITSVIAASVRVCPIITCNSSAMPESGAIASGKTPNPPTPKASAWQALTCLAHSGATAERPTRLRTRLRTGRLSNVEWRKRSKPRILSH
jgi:hypothetical protein